MNRQISVSPANSKKVAAPPYSMSLMKSEWSKPNNSTVIWQAIIFTSASIHSSRRQRVRERLQAAADVSGDVRATAALRPGQAEPGSVAVTTSHEILITVLAAMFRLAPDDSRAATNRKHETRGQVLLFAPSLFARRNEPSHPRHRQFHFLRYRAQGMHTGEFYE